MKFRKLALAVLPTLMLLACDSDDGLGSTAIASNLNGTAESKEEALKVQDQIGWLTGQLMWGIKGAPYWEQPIGWLVNGVGAGEFGCDLGGSYVAASNATGSDAVLPLSSKNDSFTIRATANQCAYSAYTWDPDYEKDYADTNISGEANYKTQLIDDNGSYVNSMTADADISSDYLTASVDILSGTQHQISFSGNTETGTGSFSYLVELNGKSYQFTGDWTYTKNIETGEYAESSTWQNTLHGEGGVLLHQYHSEEGTSFEFKGEKTFEADEE